MDRASHSESGTGQEDKASLELDGWIEQVTVSLELDRWIKRVWNWMGGSSKSRTRWVD